MRDVVSLPAARRQRDAIAAACVAADDAGFLDEVIARLRRIVPFDGVFAAATDPITSLAISPSVVQNVSPTSCMAYWESEFLIDDYLRLTDLVRAPRSVATLHDVTGGRPTRSPRHQAVNVPNGFGDELRAALSLGGLCWGVLVLYRTAEAGRFTPAEQDAVMDLSPLLAGGFRRLALRRAPGGVAGVDAPGVLLFDAAGHYLAGNESVPFWLSDLATSPPGHLPGGGPPVPTEVLTVVSRARAIAQRSAPGTARVRVLGRSGRWLVVHATAMVGGDDPSVGQIAVVIEPASASEVVPIVARAFELTDREMEVTTCVARGLDTGEIAAHLFLSPHTVRDHLKSVFEKVGVSSRGELVARLFSTVDAVGAHVPV